MLEEAFVLHRSDGLYERWWNVCVTYGCTLLAMLRDVSYQFRVEEIFIPRRAAAQGREPRYSALCNLDIYRLCSHNGSLSGKNFNRVGMFDKTPDRIVRRRTVAA